MDGIGEYGHYPWYLWMIFGFAMWAFFCPPRYYRRNRHRRRGAASEKSAEIERLKSDLDASLAQIETLKARLEAVETIVTDEEAELRREFRRLQEG